MNSKEPYARHAAVRQKLRQDFPLAEHALSDGRWYGGHVFFSMG
jgi:hypothetical protein